LQTPETGGRKQLTRIGGRLKVFKHCETPGCYPSPVSIAESNTPVGDLLMSEDKRPNWTVFWKKLAINIDGHRRAHTPYNKSESTISRGKNTHGRWAV
jgi:hypothetical protein